MPNKVVSKHHDDSSLVQNFPKLKMKLFVIVLSADPFNKSTVIKIDGGRGLHINDVLHYMQDKNTL